MSKYPTFEDQYDGEENESWALENKFANFRSLCEQKAQQAQDILRYVEKISIFALEQEYEKFSRDMGKYLADYEELKEYTKNQDRAIQQRITETYDKCIQVIRIGSKNKEECQEFTFQLVSGFLLSEGQSDEKAPQITDELMQSLKDPSQPRLDFYRRLASYRQQREDVIEARYSESTTFAEFAPKGDMRLAKQLWNISDFGRILQGKILQEEENIAVFKKEEAERLEAAAKEKEWQEFMKNRQAQNASLGAASNTDEELTDVFLENTELNPLDESALARRLAKEKSNIARPIAQKVATQPFLPHEK